MKYLFCRLVNIQATVHAKSVHWGNMHHKLCPVAALCVQAVHILTAIPGVFILFIANPS